MLTPLSRLSLLLTLALVACTSTADDPVDDTPTTIEIARYDVSIAAAPIMACLEPDTAVAVELRGSPRLLLQLSTTPTLPLRPPQACRVVSGACGHFKVELWAPGVARKEAPTIEVLAAASVVEVPLGPQITRFGTYVLRVSLVGDDGLALLNLAGQPIVTPDIGLTVLAPDDVSCRPAETMDGGVDTAGDSAS